MGFSHYYWQSIDVTRRMHLIYSELNPPSKSQLYYMPAPRATDRTRMISEWSKIWRWHRHTSMLASSSGVLPTHAVQLVLSVSAGLYLKTAPAVMAPSKLWSFHFSSRKLWIELESTMFKRNSVCSGHGSYYACVWLPGDILHSPVFALHYILRNASEPQNLICCRNVHF